MYAITGITGQVGGAAARSVIASGAKVRAVLRDAEKGAIWAARGCQVAIADMADADALASAFHDAEGVFLLVPPMFDPAPGFPEVRAVITAIMTARVVPREAWEAVFVGQGAKHPDARALMLDGFNEGWLTFDAEGGDPICGTISIDTVIAELVERTASSPLLAGEPSIKSARS